MFVYIFHVIDSPFVKTHIYSNNNFKNVVLDRMLHVLEQNQNDDNLSFISYFNLTFTANPDKKQKQTI